MNIFKGMGVAMVTPFTKDGNIDWEGLNTLTEHLVSNGADYLVVMGTTGENPTLTITNQTKILKAIQEVNQGRIPVVYGIGGNHTSAVVERLQNTDLTGVDGILSVSPYYNKPNAAGLMHHFTQLADASTRPIILYNVPGRTGSMMPTDVILELANHEKIVAIKEASGSMDQINTLIMNKKDDFSIISGDDAYTLPFMAMGMDGVISVIGNAFPKDFSQMVRYAMDGNFENARYLHYKLLPLMEAVFEDGNPGGVKYILKKLGICDEYMRAPLGPIHEGLRAKMDALIEAY